MSSPCSSHMSTVTIIQVISLHMPVRHIQCYHKHFTYTRSFIFSHPRTSPSTLSYQRQMLILPPLCQSLLPRPPITPTPFPHNAPRSCPHNVFHALLHPDDARQLFRPRLTGEEPRRVRVQPFIHHPLPVLLLLDLPDCCLRVVRIRRGGHQCAVAEHLRSSLPGGEQNFVFEFLAGGWVDLAG